MLGSLVFIPYTPAPPCHSVHSINVYALHKQTKNNKSGINLHTSSFKVNDARLYSIQFNPRNRCEGHMRQEKKRKPELCKVYDNTNAVPPKLGRQGFA